MAATNTETILKTTTTTTKPPRTTKLVCFSYAAYAKNLIDHLKSLNIPVLPGLNDPEFADIESTFGFTFPPDLRSILREGLPVGPAFPNWRSSSHQQLHILVNLPVLSLSKNVTLNNFWSGSWGRKPRDKNDALASITKLLDRAPVLVPIYRNCYVPSTPNMAGNPVFYIDTEGVRVLSFDLAGFFKEVEFVKASGSGGFFKSKVLGMPAWAAKEARRIEFWTDVAEKGRRVAAARDDTRAWWTEDWVDVGLGLECCLEDVFRRLRDGGWTEEEVKEMMMMMDGCDDDDDDASIESSGVQSVGDCRGGVGLHVRLLSLVLLRGGWSKEDVVYSLDLQDQENLDGVDSLEGNSDDNYFEFQRPIRWSKEGGDHHDHCHQKSSIKHLMHIHTLQVLR